MEGKCKCNKSLIQCYPLEKHTPLSLDDVRGNEEKYSTMCCIDCDT